METNEIIEYLKTQNIEETDTEKLQTLHNTYLNYILNETGIQIEETKTITARITDMDIDFIKKIQQKKLPNKRLPNNRNKRNKNRQQNNTTKSILNKPRKWNNTLENTTRR